MSLIILRILKRLALLGLGIFLPLVFFEVGIRILVPQDLDFYNSGKIMRPSTQPGQRMEFIPWSVNESYVGVPVRINSLGLRDNNEVAVPKPAGHFRILAVGDSITFGFGVRLEETYAKRLEYFLNGQFGGAASKFEVINAGIEGTGLEYYFHFLRKRGIWLQPDLVLVGIALNDIGIYWASQHTENHRNPTVTAMLANFNRFIRSHSHGYAYVYMSLKSIFYKTKILDINRAYAGNFTTLGPPTVRQTRAWSSSFERLRNIVDLVRNRKIPIVFVVFPMEMQLGPEVRDLYRQTLGIELDDNAVSGEPQKRLSAFAAAQEVPLVDLLPPFSEHQNKGLFLRNKSISHDWAHPSAEGHNLAAQEIYQHLIKLGLIPLANLPR